MNAPKTPSLIPCWPFHLTRAARSVRTTSALRSRFPRPFARRSLLPASQAASIADLKWFEIFKDDKLQELIRTALEQNYDLARCRARVEAGAGQSGHHPVRSVSQFRRRRHRRNQSPLARRRHTAAAAVPPSQNRNFGAAALDLLSFEVDIWGRLRRATEAARANLLSADENRKAVVTTLVSDVATAYLSLRELDYELEISRRTLQTREESLELTRSRQIGGVSTLLDLRQAEQLVDTAAQTIPGIRAAHRTDRESDHAPAGRKPGECHARENPHRARLASGSARRFALGTCWNGGPISAPRSRH